MGYYLCAALAIFLAYFVWWAGFADKQLPATHFNDAVFEWPVSLTYKVYNVGSLPMHAVDGAPAEQTSAIPRVILFLHGFPETAHMWKDYLKHYQRRGFRVLAPDLRYFNNSQPPATAPAFTLDTLIDDVAGFLEAASVNGKVEVVCHDWGCAGAAWPFVAKHPERVASLVAFNVPHLEVYREHNLLNMPFALKYVWYFLFFGLLPDAAVARIEADDYAWLLWFAFGTSKPGAYSKSHIAQLKASWQVASMRNMLRWYEMGTGWLLRSPLPPSMGGTGPFGSLWNVGESPVSVPTLLMFASDDAYVDQSLANSALADRFILHFKKELVMLPASHWLPLERPQECISHMDRFIG